MVHPNIYPIYDLLECVKELVLQNNNYRISMTQGNSRISERSVGEGPVTVCRGPEPDQWLVAMSICDGTDWTLQLPVLLGGMKGCLL